MSQLIKNYQIANNSIKTFVLNSDASNAINNPLNFANAANVAAVAANTLAVSQSQQLTPIINVVSITDSSYNVLDDTAANTTGAYLQITGSNFTSGVIVLVGGNTATSTTLVNSSVIRAQVPAISSGTYPVYVVNTNGATGIRVNGLTTSSFPAWNTSSTLANTAANTFFSVSLSANSDSSITYANTTVLPTGTTLLSNGYFYGTVSTAVQTTYSFTVDATDAEKQDAIRTFSLTVTVGAPTTFKIWSVGRNISGGLGLNDTVYRSSPVQVGSDSTWTKIGQNGDNGVGIKSNGTLWAWGVNTNGQLGQNDTIYRSSPVQIGAATNWSSISVGYGSCLALKTDGTLWSWGYNAQGQLGSNNNVARSSPTQVGALTNWSKIASGYTSVAIKTDGTLWTWGLGGNGTIGQNDNVARSSPTQVGALTNWSQISNSNQTGLAAIKTNGTLWAWGYNNWGQLGQNDVVNRSSPTQVGTATDWSLSCCNYYENAAIKTNGTLWIWGKNDNGQLGQNDLVHRSSPTQVGVATDWSLVAVCYNSSAALKTNNTMWTWGKNDKGGLGLNDVVNRSSPTQVGTSTIWYNISMGVLNAITASSS